MAAAPAPAPGSADAATLALHLSMLRMEVLILNKVIVILFVTGIRKGWHIWIMQEWGENDNELSIDYLKKKKTKNLLNCVVQSVKTV